MVSYVIVPFLRDIAEALQWQATADWLEHSLVRVSLSMALLWTFVWINIRGLKGYERTLIPLMILMFALGFVVIIVGWTHNHQDFTDALQQRSGQAFSSNEDPVFSWPTLLSGAAVLFASFIGFDSIAQAGGEAKKPERNLPLAILLAIGTVGSFYFLFTGAVYHAVPWQYIAQEAALRDVTAPGLFSILLPAAGAAAILGGAAVALINDLPAMLLSVSRLLFAWADDGIFPKPVARIHTAYSTPHIALTISGLMASIGILGSHFAGDFFLGIDIMVTAMLVNFWLMCGTVLTLPVRNPALASRMHLIRSRPLQWAVALPGLLLLSLFLVIHIYKDLSQPAEAWYFHSTWVWLLVMAIATLIYGFYWRQLKPAEKAIFKNLPAE